MLRTRPIALVTAGTASVVTLSACGSDDSARRRPYEDASTIPCRQSARAVTTYGAYDTLISGA
ncbi:hypothetical protein [Tsukamurella soli]